MSMLSTRATTRSLESHTATYSFDPSRLSLGAPTPSCTSSSTLSYPPHTIPPLDRISMAAGWPIASNSSSSSSISEHPPFAHQEPTGMVTDSAAVRGGMRIGYATRSTTCMLPRNIHVSEQAAIGTNLFSMGSISHTAESAGSMVRKKRRRYGPKPQPPYTCFCGKVFKRHEHMLRHRATHDDNIKYECHMCGKSFRRQDVMHRHTMTHAARSRQSNKMRTTASMSATTAPASANASTSGSNRKGTTDDDKMSINNVKREKEHALPFFTANAQYDVLEDPTLRVGLAEYPTESASSRHNQDHHIAAAQLYSACNTTKYLYPTYPVTMQPIYAHNVAIDVGDAGYARSDNFDAMADYHSRISSSMSPPPAFLASATGFGANTLGADQFGGSAGMTRPQAALPMTTVGMEYEYETKPNGQDPGSHYAPNWHGGSYGIAHGAMHMGACESDWSEQSPSGPSTHTFASPAWSQKAELMRREGTASASSGTPLGPSSSNRQLSMDPGWRWHTQTQHQPQMQTQHHQPQSQYQHGSPLVGGGAHKDASLGSVDRSPAQIVRRRLSNMQGSGSYATNFHDAHMYAVHGAAAKAETYGEPGFGMGLCLLDQPNDGQDSGSLGLVTMPTLAHESTMNESGRDARVVAQHHGHISPHGSNVAMVMSSSSPSSSSPGKHAGAGMSSMHVSQSASHHALPSYPTPSKHGLSSMSSVMEPFDTGSPLTEATGNASPRSHSNRDGNGYAVGGSMHAEVHREPSNPPIDPNLGEDGNDNPSNSSSPAANLQGGHTSRRW